MKRKNGFTLVELVIVIGLVIIIAVLMTSSLNPIRMVSGGKDAVTKRNLGKIKLAFEDYYSDKGCYPDQILVGNLNNSDNCGTSVFSPWLSKWICDPRNTAYMVFVEDADCPSYFKVLANLEDKSDDDIPVGWYSSPDTMHVGDGTITAEEANYGVSSSNVTWYERVLASYCDRHNCYSLTSSCQASSGGCFGSNCYRHNDCLPECKVEVCD